MPHRILAINPGSTSTKLALFEDDEAVVEASIAHSTDELAPFARITDQTEMRLACVRRFLDENRIDLSSLTAIVGRGGLLRPIESGVFRVSDAMLRDLRSGHYGEHASNLGAVLAFDLAQDAGCLAYIVDPVVVDEMADVARLSGMPDMERKSIFHALNQKSAAREVAGTLGKTYADCNFIVAHLGGGISVGAHCRGRVADVNNALNGDGPFSPERTGSLPVWQLVELCLSGSVTRDELKKRIVGRGGLVAYCGTNRMDEVQALASNGDAQAALVLQAMVYQISQEICKHGATLNGQVDRIILTGGMARDEDFVQSVRARVEHLAPVAVVPGEREMLSLARGVLAVLQGQEPEKEYGA